jgi:hypothetical protein
MSKSKKKIQETNPKDVVYLNSFDDITKTDIVNGDTLYVRRFYFFDQVKGTVGHVETVRGSEPKKVAPVEGNWLKKLFNK